MGTFVFLLWVLTKGVYSLSKTQKGAQMLALLQGAWKQILLSQTAAISGVEYNSYSAAYRIPL